MERRIDGRVAIVDALKEGIHHLHWGEIAPSDTQRQFSDRHVERLVGHVHPISLFHCVWHYTDVLTGILPINQTGCARRRHDSSGPERSRRGEALTREIVVVPPNAVKPISWARACSPNAPNDVVNLQIVQQNNASTSSIWGLSSHLHSP